MLLQKVTVTVYTGAVLLPKKRQTVIKTNVPTSLAPCMASKKKALNYISEMFYNIMQPLYKQWTDI